MIKTHVTLHFRGVWLIAGFLLMLFWTHNAVGQELVCQSPTPTADEIAERETRIIELKRQRKGGRLAAGGIEFFPVKFHIIRRSNGTTAVTQADLNTALSGLNHEYRNSSIRFFMAGSTPNYIDSDTFYDFKSEDEGALTLSNDVTDAINVYVPGSILYQSTVATGYAYYPSRLARSNRLFVRADRLADGRTLSHELGHYFNLLHTFQNSTNSNLALRELVTRGPGNNCGVAGDMLCDTPADPYGLSGGTTIQGCTYLGTARDPNGDLYQPPLDNLMSYYFQCGSVFTSGQQNRIEDGVLLRTAPDNQFTLSAPPSSSVPSQLIANPVAGGVRVTFSDPGNDESGFIIERSTGTTGNYVAVAGLEPNVTTYIDAGVNSNTLYSYRVRTTNGIQYSATDTAQVRVFYCRPNYTRPCSPVIIADFLLQKNQNSLISKINTGCGTDSYSDFSATPAVVQTDQSYTFTARAVTGGSGTYTSQYLSIWVDLNGNGLFEESERLFQATGTTRMAPTLTGTITIPASAQPGLTRMRIRTGASNSGPVNDPCNQLPSGEVEDYALEIQEPTSASVSITLVLKAFLEGPYQSGTGQMATTLNQRGLLPGQTPVSNAASATPGGQPYRGAPWNHTGSESVTTYQTNIVDWVLISLRAGSPLAASTVYKTAALLRSDGQVILVGNEPTLSTGQSYYIAIEHRNHLGVVSHIPVSIQNGALNYNFTTQNSFTNTNPVSAGQKQIGTIFALHCGDGVKTPANQNSVINAADYLQWLSLNGKFDQYSTADYTMDARISAFDFLIWSLNNSRFSLVGR